MSVNIITLQNADEDAYDSFQANYKDYVFKIKKFKNNTTASKGTATLVNCSAPLESLTASVFKGKDNTFVYDILKKYNGKLQVVSNEKLFISWENLIERLVMLID